MSPGLIWSENESIKISIQIYAHILMGTSTINWLWEWMKRRSVKVEPASRCLESTHHSVSPLAVHIFYSKQNYLASPLRSLHFSYLLSSLLPLFSFTSSLCQPSTLPVYQGKLIGSLPWWGPYIPFHALLHSPSSCLSVHTARPDCPDVSLIDLLWFC